MKRSMIIMLALAATCEAFTLQSGEITVIEKQKPGQSDSGNNITVIIGNDLLRFDGNDSLVIIKMGDRGLNIIESTDGRKLNLEKYEREESGINEKYDKWDDDREENDRSRGGRHFRGHWAGFEIGFNNYMYASSMTLPAEISYMTLNASKSNCFNLNFSQVNIGFGRHAGLVSGIGLNWNTYRFDGINSIAVNSEGNIAELIPDSSVPLKKSKFNTLYLNVPIRWQIRIVWQQLELELGECREPGHFRCIKGPPNQNVPDNPSVSGIGEDGPDGEHQRVFLHPDDTKGSGSGGHESRYLSRGREKGGKGRGDRHFPVPVQVIPLAGDNGTICVKEEDIIELEPLERIRVEPGPGDRRVVSQQKLPCIIPRCPVIGNGIQRIDVITKGDKDPVCILLGALLLHPGESLEYHGL